MFSSSKGGNHRKQTQPRHQHPNDVHVVPPIIPQVPHAGPFIMPHEEHRHEGTWLQWPHNYGWDPHHVARYETSWVQMAAALHTGERVHIVAYNDVERDRVERVLRQTQQANDGGLLDMSQIDFFVSPTDDVWVRDNGPIFVFDDTTGAAPNPETRAQLCIANFVFNGYGDKADYYYNNYIPLKIGHVLGLPVIDVPMVHEGGSVEVDGRGTLMAKRSSILNDNRNIGWTQADAERYFRHYLGVTNFIWLQGKKGGSDITDDHIDGTARFANGDTIVTYHKKDFVNPGEYKVLQQAVDVNGRPYELVHLPVTTKKVAMVDDHGMYKLGDYGSYINFYVGNDVVLVPSYDDPNDHVAVEILQQLYPTRKIVAIPSVEVFRDGGMMHCVTQQQPAVEEIVL